jgi:hypothetical protein
MATVTPAQGTAELLGRLRYNVIHYFKNAKNKTRRTSKLVEWRGKSALTGKPGTEERMRISVRYFDEIEE